MKLSDNKAFQTLIGAGVCYLAFRLYMSGWFGIFFSDGGEVYSTPAIVPMLLAAVASALQLVGILAIAIASGVLSIFSPLLNLLIGQANALKDKLARKKLPANIADKVDDADVPQIDSQKLNDVLNDFNKRISGLEIIAQLKDVVDHLKDSSPEATKDNE